MMKTRVPVTIVAAALMFFAGYAALLIAPEGTLVEQLTGDPLQRAIDQTRGDGHKETLLWDVTDSIRAAAKDRRIPVIALDLDKLDEATLPALQ